MSDVAEISSSCETIDKSVLASLRELQDEGEPDIVIELADLFFANAPAKIETIKDGLAKGDAKAVHIAAHSLKSSSSYLGATRLSALAKELEDMGRQGKLDGGSEIAAQVEEEYGKVKACLDLEMERGEKNRLD
jgi:HPt (histidine-containing phosphotransfer) domain-containing protein